MSRGGFSTPCCVGCPSAAAGGADGGDASTGAAGSAGSCARAGAAASRTQAIVGTNLVISTSTDQFTSGRPEHVGHVLVSARHVEEGATARRRRVAGVDADHPLLHRGPEILAGLEGAQCPAADAVAILVSESEADHRLVEHRGVLDVVLHVEREELHLLRCEPCELHALHERWEEVGDRELVRLADGADTDEEVLVTAQAYVGLDEIDRLLLQWRREERGIGLGAAARAHEL